MDPNLIDTTLKLLKDYQQPLALQKAGITTGLGIVAYDLEQAAKLLYPVITPLRNSIPRSNAEPGAGLATHWKQITGINSTGVRAGVSEGNRGAVISLLEADKLATYKGLGLENSVTFEAELAARGFDDARALAGLTLLQSLMIQEEIIILNGNASMLLGTTPTPTVVPVLNSTTAGTLANSATNYFAVVALTYQGYIDVRNSIALGIQPTIARTNADGTVDTTGGGVAAISAQSTAATTDSTHSTLTASVAAVKGAAAYAWYHGQTTGLANLLLAGITTAPTFTLTAAATGTQAANATGLNIDNSTNGLEFDGLITQALQGNGYYKSLNGAKLTSDGSGGVIEIEAALKYFWDTFRVTPTQMRVGGQLLRDITKNVLAGTSNPSYHINMVANGQGSITAGTLVTTYLNKYSMGGMQALPIELHPNMPDGMIFFDCDKVPYPNANINVARRLRTRQEYYQIEWPLVSRKLTEYDYAYVC